MIARGWLFVIAVWFGVMSAAAADTLSVTRAGSGTGTVTSNVGGIDCGATCGAVYANGAPVTLTATPGAGSQFTGWLGPCTGTGACQVTVSGATVVSATFASTATGTPTLNIDGAGGCDALTDGLLVIRRLFGLSGAAMIQGAVAAGATRATGTQIGDYLQDIAPTLDIDGNGVADALTDGLLVIRYLFGLRGPSLVAGAIGPGASRSSAAAVEAWIAAIPCNAAATVLLANDGYSATGDPAAFQGGFATGEIAAVRFVPDMATQIRAVRFLFGGAAGTRDVTLRIWTDTGALAPGTPLFTQTYSITASNAMQEISLAAAPVSVSGPFRVGLQFTAAGLPSVARDVDGTITPGRNFVMDAGQTWQSSETAGITGDWVIRAVVGSGAPAANVGGTVSGLNGTLVLQNNGGDNLTLQGNGPFTFATPLAIGAAYSVTVLSKPAAQDCLVGNGAGTIEGTSIANVTVTCSNSVLANDTFPAGGPPSFQAGFVAGEIAAVRLVPAAATKVKAVRFLFGGAAGTRNVTLRIWNDTGAAAPGTPLFAQTYSVTASSNTLREIDLSATPVNVAGPFRVGIELTADNLPSVATDGNGGIIADRNFVFLSGSGWMASTSAGITSNWVIRAVIGD